MMIGTVMVFSAPGITDAQLSQMMDSLADLEAVCPDLLDWGAAAALDTGRVEIEMTLESGSPEAAIARAKEIIETTLHLASPHQTQKVTAELIDA